jgi:hypothetical protein
MKGIEVGALRAAHKHYEYKTNSDAPKVTKEQESMKETCFSILAEGEVHQYNKNRYVYVSPVLVNTCKRSACIMRDGCIYFEEATNRVSN